MKILLLDIETAPNVAYVWGLWQQNIAINQIANSGYVMCWAAKWYGEEGIAFSSIKSGSERTMLNRAHKLLNEADVVVHYNGANFDIPTLNKEFLIKKMKPPAPYKQVDLLRVVRDAFRFPSNKLDYVSQTLGLGEKVRHTGHELWVRCMAREAEAWKEMEGYNRYDVVLLERLYDRLKPWIRSHPNHGTYEDRSVCPNCASERVHRRGLQRTTTMHYPRFQCQDCGTWFRGAFSVKSARPERYVSITK